VELNPVSKKKPAEEWMRRKRKPSEKECEEEYLESRGWPRDNLWPGDADLCWVILQNAVLGGVLQILLQELGLNPIAYGGHIGINSLGARLGLLRGGHGDTDGGRSSLAHGGGARAGALTGREERCTVMAGR
jgi:hypothetical protein